MLVLGIGLKKHLLMQESGLNKQDKTSEIGSKELSKTPQSGLTKQVMTSKIGSNK